MEVSGVDGLLKLDKTTLTILWTSLSGRVRNSGAELEVIPLEKIFDHLLIPSSPMNLGSLQIRLLGAGTALNPLNRDSQMLTSISESVILHSIMFHESSFLHFMSFEKELGRRVVNARTKIIERFIGTQEGTTSS